MEQTPRTVRTILQWAAFFTFWIGLGTLLIPEVIIHWFDGFEAPNLHFVRFIGTALIGFSVINWLYSRLNNLEYILPAIYGNLASLSLAIIVDAIGLYLHMLAPLAWLILALHAVFAGAFLYCVLLIRRFNSRE